MGRLKIGSNEYYEFQYKKLIKYCKKYNWKVTEKYNITDFVSLDLNHIFINKRRSAKNKVYCLLHEIGHILVARGTYYDYIYQHRFCEKKIKKKNSFENIITLDEEFAAWRKALILAKKMNIFIDRDDFERIKMKCLMTYITECD